MDINYLIEKTNYYNEKYWGKKFKGMVKIDTKIKVYGDCTYPFNIRVNPKQKPFSFSISHVDDSLETLLHELCHWNLYEQGINHDHRHKVWKDTLNKVNEPQKIHRAMVVLGEKDNWNIGKTSLFFLDEIDKIQPTEEGYVLKLSNRDITKTVTIEKADTFVLSSYESFIGDDYMPTVKQKNVDFFESNKSYFLEEVDFTIEQVGIEDYKEFDKVFKCTLDEQQQGRDINKFLEMHKKIA